MRWRINLRPGSTPKDVFLDLPLKNTGKDGGEFTAALSTTLPEEHGATESQQRLEIIERIQADSRQDRSVDVVWGNFAKTG